VTNTPPLVALAAVLAMAATAVHADDDTEYHYGFMVGTDVGAVGEKELQGRTTGRFGKRAGSYGALSQKIEAEFVPARDLRFSVGAAVAYHDIAGVPGLDDRRQGAFEALSFGVKYRLLDRAHAPFGLAIEAEPQWARLDGTSGAPVDQYGVQLSILLDRELIANRIVAAFNLVYEPEASRSRITGVWSHESNLRVSAAIMAQAQAGIFLGTELRYLRQYEGLGLDRFAGHALYLGPTLFAKLSEQCWFVAAWSVQVAGRAADEPGSLDLTNAERHQVRFKLGVNF
jgi:hypothetical protein